MFMYLNCGNVELENAARDWAKMHGCQITSRSGSRPTRWRYQQMPRYFL